MGRTLLMALAGLSILTLLGEVLAGALLWSQGRLNADAVREIRAILHEAPVLDEEDAQSREEIAVSTEDVIAARAMRVLQIEEREREQELLTALIADSRFNVIAEQTSLKAAKDEFARQQEALQKKRQSEAVELARAVLTRADGDMAVRQLMELTLDENLMIILGMPEKKIAELLAAFENGDTATRERGAEIFQAISRGTLAATTDPATGEDLP